MLSNTCQLVVECNLEFAAVRASTTMIRTFGSHEYLIKLALVSNAIRAISLKLIATYQTCQSRAQLQPHVNNFQNYTTIQLLQVHAFKLFYMKTTAYFGAW